MSVTPLPTSPAAEKSPSILQVARYLGEFHVMGDMIEGLTDGTGCDRFLAQISGIAALLQTALAVMDEGDGAVIAPPISLMESAAGAIRNLSILASFADCAAEHQHEESLGVAMGGKRQ